MKSFIAGVEGKVELHLVFSVFFFSLKIVQAKRDHSDAYRAINITGIYTLKM